MKAIFKLNLVTAVPLILGVPIAFFLFMTEIGTNAFLNNVSVSVVLCVWQAHIYSRLRCPHCGERLRRTSVFLIDSFFWSDYAYFRARCPHCDRPCRCWWW